jgi:hypothetical protein
MHAVAGIRIGKFITEGCLVSLVNESSTLVSDGFYHKGVYDFIDALR